MGTVSITQLTTGQQNVTATQFNNLVTPIMNEVNGSLDNSNISASANIAYSKLSLGGNILNADINASAAIDFSKLATLTDGNILVGNGSNQAASVAVSGDVTIANTGAATIANDAVETAMIADSNVTLAKMDSTAKQGIIKAWAHFDGDGSTGAKTVNDSYNVTGVNKDATGVYTVTWDTNFASANYAVSVVAIGANVRGQVSTQAAGSCVLTFTDAGGSAGDATKCSIMAIGDQ